jgi:hypothetical protein
MPDGARDAPLPHAGGTRVLYRDPRPCDALRMSRLPRRANPPGDAVPGPFRHNPRPCKHLAAAGSRLVPHVRLRPAPGPAIASLRRQPRRRRVRRSRRWATKRGGVCPTLRVSASPREIPRCMGRAPVRRTGLARGGLDAPGAQDFVRHRVVGTCHRVDNRVRERTGGVSGAQLTKLSADAILRVSAVRTLVRVPAGHTPGGNCFPGAPPRSLPPSPPLQR